MSRPWVRQQRFIASAAWFYRHLKEAYKDPLPGASERYRHGVASLQIRALDDRFMFFRKDTTVVDFGCYPGSWSTVALERCCMGASSRSRVIGVDKLEMTPISGVTFLQGTVGTKATLDELKDLLGGRKADVVLSDLTPVVTDDRRLEETSQAALALVGAEMAEEILSLGGTFVCRVPFAGSSIAHLRTFLRCRFRRVETHVTKYFIQSDLPSEGATQHLLANQRYMVGLQFLGREPLASEVQVKGHFDPYEGRLGEMVTDLLDKNGTMMDI